MTWIDVWWGSRVAQLGRTPTLTRRPAVIPNDGAGWLSLLIQAGLEGRLNG